MNCHEDLYTLDKKRYGTGKMSGFQKYWRLTNTGGTASMVWSTFSAGALFQKYGLGAEA